MRIHKAAFAAFAVLAATGAGLLNVTDASAAEWNPAHANSDSSESERSARDRTIEMLEGLAEAAAEKKALDESAIWDNTEKVVVFDGVLNPWHTASNIGGRCPVGQYVVDHNFNQGLMRLGPGVIVDEEPGIDLIFGAVHWDVIQGDALDSKRSSITGYLHGSASNWGFKDAHLKISLLCTKNIGKAASIDALANVE